MYVCLSFEAREYNLSVVVVRDECPYYYLSLSVGDCVSFLLHISLSWEVRQVR